MEYPFISIFLLLIGLILLFMLLLKLRTLREATIQEEMPSDKLTVLLGMFFVLSRACIKYYRDRNAYPQSICGTPESLIELGYLKDEPLATISNSIRLFSIVVTDKAGCGICLAHIKASVAMDILRRVSDTNCQIEFQDYRGGQYKPLTSAGDTLINLTLPLPVRPVGSKAATPGLPESGTEGTVIAA
ncbi:MAG: hypothetical protein G8237_05020 [Magnetococcales bacterium]|nr:hypothetical protein [Magnetococcales bacterium]